MSIHIDDLSVQKLANEIAAQTGESVTEVIRVALEERKKALNVAAPPRRASRHEIRALLESIHALPKIGPKVDHAQLLYDEHGLPK